MTYIKSMKMHGFKSFAKPTELVFDKELSIVVGPNGAGKSNVMDAICFVLGRLSMKSIRAKHASNLIYHGGNNNRPADEAQVEMILDNSEKIFAVDGDAKIERIVRNDGNSIYRINGKTKTRQEVLELLGQAGIDPTGFNIILQNEISRFVEMHGEERRQIIEEIAGISVYEERKQKSLNEMTKTDEKLKEVSAVLNERRAYLRNLESERGEALKYKKHEENVKRGKATLLHKDIEDKEKETDNNNEEINRKIKIIEDKKASLKKIDAETEKLKVEIEKINKNINEASGIEQENLNKEIVELKEQIAGLIVNKGHYESKIEENNRRKEELENSIKEYELKIEELKKAKPKKAKSSENLENKKKDFEEIEAKRNDFYKIRQKHSEIKNRLEDKKEMLQRIKNQSDFTFKQMESSSSQLSEMTEDFEKVSKKLDDIREKYEDNKETIEKNNNSIIEFEKNISKKETEIIGQQRIKQNILKIDICPICKTKLTKEHVEHVIAEADRISSEAETEIGKFRQELEQIKGNNIKIKKELEEHSEIIRNKEFDLKHINDISLQKEHMLKLKADEEKVASEVSELEKQNDKFEEQLKKFENIEENYDNLRIEVQELSEISEDNKDARLSLNTIELEKIKNEIRRIGREQEENEDFFKDTSSELDEKQDILEDKEKQHKVLSEKFHNLYNKKTFFQDRIVNLEKEQIKIGENIKQEEEAWNNMKINRARINAEQKTLLLRFKEFEGSELLPGSREKVQEILKTSADTLIRIGSVNMRALEVYDEMKNKYDEIAEKVQKLEIEKQDIMNIIADIDKKKKKAFMKVFTEINDKFRENWSKLSIKGIANMELENEENPFEGGISIVQKIAKGKYTDAGMLSGGERVLMALSLIFAIQEYRPYHFYIFDEIDAALDKRNSEKLANLIKSCTGKAQYIVITHNDSVMSEAANYLYGVTMQEGISKIISLKI